VIVIEATYGMPQYVFPSTDAMMGVMKDLIDDNISQGMSVALLAYPLGKSQELIRMFGNLTPYLHGSVMNMTRLVEGTETLSKCLPYSKDSVKKPFLMICPPGVRNSNSIRHWKKKGTRITMVSGWSVESSFKHKMLVDEAFPFSDHADFEELMTFVKACDPSVVFTHHGFSEELASEIQRSSGIEAHPLIRNQKSLLEF
jgi:putative mRNA 3-end processing factor